MSEPFSGDSAKPVSPADKLSLLRQQPLFRQLPEEPLRQLAEVAGLRWLERSATLFAQGQPAAAVFVVLSGRVAVSKLSADGKEQLLRVWEPGDLVGEVALFGNLSYPAHAQMVEAGHLLVLPRGELLAAIGRSPGLALALLGAFAQRMRHLSQMVEELALKELPSRLAGHLLYLSERQGDPSRARLDLPRRRLAALLGTQPETLTRTLKRLEAEGLLQPEGARTYILQDRHRLQELAAGSRQQRRPPAPRK